MMEFDPLNLRRFGKYYKPLWSTMVVTPICLLVSLLFFLIVLSSSRDSQLSAVNSAAYTWNTEALAKQMQTASFVTKIMPSQGHGVSDQMEWTNVEVPEYQAHLDTDLRGALTAYDVSYHIYAKDTLYKFPELILSEKMVPVGMSELKCLNVAWSSLNQANPTHAYQSIKNLPDCARASTGVWSEHDPTKGVDLYVWKQSTTDLSCSGSSCVDVCRAAGGTWVLDRSKDKGNCYIYDVLDSICLMVDKTEDAYGNVDWEYAGGCFNDDSPAGYKAGVPGETYLFASVTIQVRSVDDPYIAAVRATDDDLDFAGSTVCCM
jgi:hypothetical protein